MKRRIIRKNKKRIDPRYFLYEQLETDSEKAFDTIGGQEPEAAESLPSPLGKEEEGEKESFAFERLPKPEELPTTSEETWELAWSKAIDLLKDEHKMAAEDLAKAAGKSLEEFESQEASDDSLPPMHEGGES